MKILYIVPYVPNIIRVRPYQLIRTLIARGHNVTLATLWATPEEERELATLQAMGISILADRLSPQQSLLNCIRTLPSRTPLQAMYAWQPRLMQALSNAISAEQFDIVHVEHLRGAMYGVELKDAVRDGHSPPIVWDSVDCISHLFAQAASHSRSLKGRLMTRLDLGRTRRYEGWLMHQFDHTVVTSRIDADALCSLAQQAVNGNASQAGKISVIPNGVDLEYFAPNGVEREPSTIVFSGKMSYHANVTAALYLIQEIMPIVWQERPDLRVQIVGKDPSSEIKLLDTASSRRIQQRPTERAVEVTGTVPDLRPYLHKATIAVAPVPYGAGVQNKVLEAMACGTPVIASGQAASGVDAKVGRDLLVADDAQSFAQAILHLLSDGAAREKIGRAGREYVEEHLSWQAAVEKLEEVYSEIIRVVPK